MSEDRQLPDPPVRPRKSARARWRARLPRLPWHLDKLTQIEEAIERVLGAKVVNGPALAALLKRAQDARAIVDRIVSESPDQLAGMTPAELVEWAGLALEGWPDQVLEVALRVYSIRHRGRVVFVSEAGHRAEYDPVEGAWSRG